MSVFFFWDCWESIIYIQWTSRMKRNLWWRKSSTSMKEVGENFKGTLISSTEIGYLLKLWGETNKESNHTRFSLKLISNRTIWPKSIGTSCWKRPLNCWKTTLNLNSRFPRMVWFLILSYWSCTRWRKTCRSKSEGKSLKTKKWKSAPLSQTPFLRWPQWTLQRCRKAT